MGQYGRTGEGFHGLPKAKFEAQRASEITRGLLVWQIPRENCHRIQCMYPDLKNVRPQQIFVTRASCVHDEDGRILSVVTSQLNDMPDIEWHWLEQLHFGCIIFFESSSGEKCRFRSELHPEILTAIVISCAGTNLC